MLDNKLIQIIEELYSIPNAPFSINLRSKYVKSFIEKSGFEYEETPYYIKTVLNKGQEKKTIFMSHLDHPGFVFKNNKEGIAFGSLYLHKVKKYLPISIYSPEGKYLGDAKLLKAFGRDESNIEIESDFSIPINSQGLWNVGGIKFENEKLFGRSHDNDIATALMLFNLSMSQNKEYEIIFVFTKHEEVLQLSSFNIAKNNSLNITSNDIVINLESMKVYPTTDLEKYSKLNYNNGPVLNISEATSIYSKSGKNLAESLINNISKSLNIPLQRGLAGGTSDSRPVSEFNLTDNIVTLNIPNQFKHNSDGENVRSEEILIKDITSVSKIIESVIRSVNLQTESNVMDISNEVVKGNFLTKEHSYLPINYRLDLAFRDIISRGYYYPLSMKDIVKDTVWKLLSYGYFFLIGSKKSVQVSKR